MVNAPSTEVAVTDSVTPIGRAHALRWGEPDARPSRLYATCGRHEHPPPRPRGGADTRNTRASPVVTAFDGRTRSDGRQRADDDAAQAAPQLLQHHAPLRARPAARDLRAPVRRR